MLFKINGDDGSSLQVCACGMHRSQHRGPNGGRENFLRANLQYAGYPRSVRGEQSPEIEVVGEHDKFIRGSVLEYRRV